MIVEVVGIRDFGVEKSVCPASAAGAFLTQLRQLPPNSRVQI